MTALIAVLALPASARTFSVCASGCEYRSIQPAIDAAEDGDLIRIGSGAYPETLVIEEDLDLWPASASSRVVVVGDGMSPTLSVKAGASVRISSLGFTGGGGDAGIVNHGTLLLTDAAVVYANYAASGGILNTGTLSIDGNSGIISNTATDDAAGGITNQGGSVFLDAVSLVDNEGFRGGALLNHGGIAEIQDALFVSNVAYIGGGINNTGGQLTLTNTTLRDNAAALLGGAIANPEIEGTITLSGNATLLNAAAMCESVYDVLGSPGCE